MKPRNNSMSASQHIFYENVYTLVAGQNGPNKMSTDEASPERKIVGLHFDGVMKMTLPSAASIWFEILVSWIRVQKFSIFPCNLTNKFRYFQANFRKISIFQAISQQILNFQAQIAIYSYF